MKRLYSLVVISVVLYGCMTDRPIRVWHQLDDDTECESTQLRNVSIAVMPFVDVRKSESKEKNELFNRTENKIDCVNLEVEYLSDSVSIDIARLLSKHFQKAWCYKRIYVERNDSADFYVTGKIVDFYGYAKLDKQARYLELSKPNIGIVLVEEAKKQFDSPLRTRILFSDVEIRSDG